MEYSLKQIKAILQDSSKDLIWGAKAVQNSKPPVINLSGLAHLRAVIEEIDSLGLFQEKVSELKNSILFTTVNDEMNIQTAEARTIIDSLTQLKELTSNFLSILLRTVPEEDASSINIKLPPINDFDELSKVSREIHVGLTQVVLNDQINGQTKIV